MAPSLTLRDGDLLPYLIGIAAGTAATAGAGVAGSAGAAILVVFCRIATRFLSERFGWPQANDEKSLPLLSGAARDVAFEDELAVLRSLAERLTKENATLVEENAMLRNRAAQPRARSVRLPEAAVTALRAQVLAAPGGELTDDLPRNLLTAPGGIAHDFVIPPFARDCLLRGLDEIGLTQTLLPEIEAFEVARSHRGTSIA